MTNTTNNKLRTVGSVDGSTVNHYTEDGNVRYQRVEIRATDNVHHVTLDFLLDAEQLMAVLQGGSAKNVTFRDMKVTVLSKEG